MKELNHVAIPNAIYFSQRLTWFEKLVLFEVTRLSRNSSCTESDEYFMDFFGVSKERLQQTFKALIEKEFIVMELQGGIRPIDQQPYPQHAFNAFDYYKQHISMRLSAIQSKVLIEWIQYYPGDVIKEAMDIVIKECPDKPFKYLLTILESWKLSGHTTLDQIKYAEEKRKRKGANQHVRHQQHTKEHKFDGGLPDLDF